MCHESTMKKLTFGSLFAGIGGFDLGLERAGMECKWQVEIDPFCQRVLKKHWPHVKRYGDIKDVRNPEPVDVVCGGFPCQDISWAGKRAGIQGEESGLWFEMLRIIEEVSPEYLLVENVSRLLSAGLETVLQGLFKVGYNAEWHCIPGFSVGSPQVRDRIYIMADTMQQGETRRRPGWFRRWVSSKKEIRCYCWDRGTEKNVQFWPEPGVGRVANGLPHQVDRINKIGNAVIPQIPELFGMAIIETHNQSFKRTAKKTPAA